MPPKLTRVVRLDSLPLNQTYFTEEGYLVDRPILTSTGIFEYTNPDGTIRRELRLPEEVFAPESLASYKGKPIIITHDAGLITKDNVHDEGVGTILSEGYRSGNDVRAEIIIHDTDEMKSAGLKELSLGYNLDLDETPGEWEGQPYDAIQRNIVINHLALVLEARAGEQARLNIDSRDRKRKGATKMSANPKKTKKRARRADGVLTPEELAQKIEEYKARRAQRLAAKADEEEAPAAEEPSVVSTEPEGQDGDDAVVAPAGEEGPSDTEAAIQMVKDRRDRRDAEGDPEDKEAAMGVIAQQDDDMEILFDIIDTLLAERDFDSCAKDGEEETAPAEETGNEDDDDEPAAVPPADGEEENTDSDDDDIPSTNESEIGVSVLNVDSVDAIVRQRVQLGIIGNALHMDGLENMTLMAAKKAVIRAVRPGIRLDGKSKAYINAAFDCAVADVKASTKKGTAYQKRQMFNQDSRIADRNDGSSVSARQRMIDRQMNKKKEDK